jgi:hypothetical protein
MLHETGQGIRASSAFLNKLSFDSHFSRISLKETIRADFCMVVFGGEKILLIALILT